MLDHVILNVRDLETSKAFYERALEPLGYSIVMDFGPRVAFGRDFPAFWIAQRGDKSGPVHVALQSPDRASVDAFYEASLAAGGTDNGPPGIRAHYHPQYYGAFVHDPDGNNIEAVCHKEQ